ncbi:hypothetical protein NKR23_g2266 [Pleurostoma richardsiae]|uniref:DUF7907 domain-containing protein n=1 Tax=Pleurostoma richardsiae TaxID=41990 RepID=A0AA38RQS1_9PEZI|nr:hypothetical protein NKR23_g2266 [Pleurostoma richardsiae]
MKATVISATLLALAASAAAQRYNTSAPFALKIESANATLDGVYLSSCHAGAAIEELCLAGTTAPGSYGTYYHNTTADLDVEGFHTGPLFWNLPANVDGVLQNVSSGLSFLYRPFGSVALPLLQPGSGEINVGFDADAKLFISNDLIESTFTDSSYPNYTAPFPVYQWFACFNYNLGYYYQSLGWATTGVATNPTCQPVNVTREFI